MHSWRVLILPYIGAEEQQLYARYNLNQPWNGLDNQKLAALRPKIYVCPSDTAARSSVDTSYTAVVGSSTVWAGSEPTRRDAIRDMPNETIQLVEVAGSGISWMEPRDLPFDVAVAGINRMSGVSISSKHNVPTDVIYRETGACVAFCDSSGIFLPQDTPSDTLKTLLTANGGEVIPKELLDARRLDWQRCVPLLALTISVLFLACIVVQRTVLARGSLTTEQVERDK